MVSEDGPVTWFSSPTDVVEVPGDPGYPADPATFDAAGRGRLSTAVRPETLSPDERTASFQVGFFHGHVALDLRTGKVLRLTRLPRRAEEIREDHLLDPAHHGIAMSLEGDALRVAGTMDDHAAVVDPRTGEHDRLLVREGGRPYRVTQSADGRSCDISWSGTEAVSRISYDTGRIVTTVPVGERPQRVRNGFVAREPVAGLPDHQPADDVQSVPVG